MKRVIRRTITASTEDSIYVYDGVSEVPENVVHAKIQDGVTVIKDSAFYYCENLVDVIIPDSVTTIEDYAFCMCSNLRDVSIGRGLVEIGDYAFAECTSLTDIIIPDSVTYIGNGVFQFCSNLTNVVIGTGVSKIGKDVFKDTPLESKYTKSRRATSQFRQMKSALADDEIYDLVYNSEYSDYIDELYNKASDKVAKNYSELFIEPSIQSGMGSVFATFESDGVVYRAIWDYQSECEDIESLIMECKSETQLVNAISKYITQQLQKARPIDDDSDITYL